MSEIPPEFPRFPLGPSAPPSSERVAAASRAVRRRRAAKASVAAAITCAAVAAVVVPTMVLTGNPRADRLDVGPASPSPTDSPTATPTSTIPASEAPTPAPVPSSPGPSTTQAGGTPSPTPTSAPVVIGLVTTANGTPVAAASVVDWDTGRITHTDSTGTFTLPCHNQQILVAPNLPTTTDGYYPHPGPPLHNGPEPSSPVPGYAFVGGGEIPYYGDRGPADQAHPVNCAAEAVTHVHVTLPAPIVLTVHVEHADGTAAAGYRFGLIESNHEWASYDVTADRTGSATFYGLAPGSWGPGTFGCDAGSSHGGQLNAGDHVERTCREGATSPTPTPTMSH